MVTRKHYFSPVTFQLLNKGHSVGFLVTGACAMNLRRPTTAVLDLRVCTLFGRIVAHSSNNSRVVSVGVGLGLPHGKLSRQQLASRNKGSCFRRGDYYYLLLLNGATVPVQMLESELTSSSHSGLMLCMRGTGVMMFVLSLPKLLSSDAWSTTSSSLSATSTCPAESPAKKSHKEG